MPNSRENQNIFRLYSGVCVQNECVKYIFQEGSTGPLLSSNKIIFNQRECAYTNLGMYIVRIGFK